MKKHSEKKHLDTKEQEYEWRSHMEKQIRLLRADEIECRAASVSEKGLSILLYKDARVDQRILDETFGMFGWKRTHQCMDGNLYCTVEAFDQEKGCWIAKQDVGTVGNYEKEKSQASDSFKRACFNWGIGRELYSAPFIWIPSKDEKIGKKDGKFYCNDHFSVSSICCGNNREIVSLAIKNDSMDGRLVYQFHSGNGLDGRKEEAIPKNNTAHRLTGKQMRTLESELQRTGVGLDAVRGRYGFDEPQDMPKELYDKVMRALAKTKSIGGAA